MLGSMVEVAAKVMKIISLHLGIKPAAVIPEASLVEDLGADSLDPVELVIAFESAFGIEIPQADVDRISTVQDAIDYIDVRAARDRTG